MIRVGIILPEDKKQIITVEIPSEPGYELLDADAGIPVQYSGLLRFEHRSHDLIESVPGKSSVWAIRPLSAGAHQARSGIKVFHVAAGRGFHWQKPIDVYLPGNLEIRSYQQHLLLINELPLEDYLMCVATSEMGAACPPAFIESQTISARSWILANIEQKHIALGIDVCNDDCCQRYQGNGNLTDQSIHGALSTVGQVLIYKGKICDARYSKSCGGITESFATIWNGNDLPYLQSIPDTRPDFRHKALPLSTDESIQLWLDDIPDTFCSPHRVRESSLKKYLGTVDESGTYFRWSFSYSQEELTALLNDKLDLDIRSVIALKPIKRGGSGRISRLEITYNSTEGKQKSTFIDSEYQIRRALHPGFLYSSCFYIQAHPINASYPQQFNLKGGGWGHGVGFCQIGALGMSLQGYTCEQILAHYYPDSQINKVY